MRRQLLIAIVGMVAGALLVAGVGTFLLANRGAHADDAAEVLTNARRVATEVPLILDVKAKRVRQGVLRVVEKTEGASFLIIRPNGELAGSVPPELSAADLDVATLTQGNAVSGSAGAAAYAAVPVTGVDLAKLGLARPGAVLVLVLVQSFSGAGLGGSYLLAVSGATLVVAALLAVLLSRRMARPLVHAVETTRRIADGDLGARVPEVAGGGPEIASLTGSINSMAESLARAKGLERQFLLSVSHDLRTPLTSVLGYAEAIADGTAPDPARAAAIIAAESRRLERLVQDLLELARLDSREFSLHPRPADVGEVVLDTAEGFRRGLEAAGLELVVAVPEPGTVTAVVDPDRLSQVIANLVENAYKYASRTVRVSVTYAPDRFAVAVDDDGPGIPGGELRLVFERLYQVAARPPARQAGSGLGLAIVAELVAAMGGAVTAISPTVPGGGGTRMEVHLGRWSPPPAPGASTGRQDR